jgi:hypothetical protein
MGITVLAFVLQAATRTVNITAPRTGALLISTAISLRLPLAQKHFPLGFLISNSWQRRIQE